MNQMALIWTTVGIICLMVGLIIFQHPALLGAPWAIGKHGFLYFIELVTGLFNATPEIITYANGYFEQTKYTEVPLNALVKIEDKLYQYGGWFFPFALLAMGIHLLFIKKAKYETRHNFESLLEQETTLWRFNRYLLKHNPFKDSKDVRKGKYRIVMQPYDFLVEQKIIRRQDGVPETVLRNKSRNVYRPSLGKVISGIESFSETERMIIAILLSAIFKEKGGHKEANFITKLKGFSLFNRLGRNFAITELSGDISYWLNDELPKSAVMKKVNAVISNCWDCSYIENLLKHHAYTQTFLRGMYIDVKRGGTFQPAYIAWMKILDRNTFYTMHSTGVPGIDESYSSKENMPGSNIESALVIRHYISERIAKCGLPEPEFDLLFDDIDKFLTLRFEKKMAA
jgi:hypothetical protein